MQRLSLKDMVTTTKIRTGMKGEALAISYLRKKGYKIIEKNYRTKLGEIDLIGNDGDCICFIEVRSSNTGKFGLPVDSIDRRKQGHIAKVALSYIKRHGIEDKLCRFDVVTIENLNTVPKIKLIKSAFELDARYKY